MVSYQTHLFLMASCKINIELFAMKPYLKYCLSVSGYEFCADDFQVFAKLCGMWFLTLSPYI